MQTAASEPEQSLLLSFPARLYRIGQGKRLVIDAAANPGFAGKPDPKLVKLLVRAHGLKEKLRANPGTRITDLAMRERLSPSYVALLLRLSLLAPDITRAILEGRQPAGFTAQKLVAHAALPLAWAEQHRLLGFA
jgi:site-specific DNA recombinase